MTFFYCSSSSSCFIETEPPINACFYSWKFQLAVHNFFYKWSRYRICSAAAGTGSFAKLFSRGYCDLFVQLKAQHPLLQKHIHTYINLSHVYFITYNIISFFYITLRQHTPLLQLQLRCIHKYIKYTKKSFIKRIVVTWIFNLYANSQQSGRFFVEIYSSNYCAKGHILTFKVAPIPFHTMDRGAFEGCPSPRVCVCVQYLEFIVSPGWLTGP